jgi:hypothetical protein
VIESDVRGEIKYTLITPLLFSHYSRKNGTGGRTRSDESVDFQQLTKNYVFVNS